MTNPVLLDDAAPPPRKSAKSPASAALWASFAAFAADIKLSHTLFALPFAASALVITRAPLPDAALLVKLLICMVAARSCAMGMNRWLDWRIDRLNPRTKQRMIPAGKLSPRAGLIWSLIWGGLFLIAAATINPLTARCAAPLLAVLIGYSFTKRWTWLCHLYLGLCLGLAPIAVAIATSGEASGAVLLLGLAVSLWTAGFDALYALQDLGFDRQQGLRSIPARFGPLFTLWFSRLAFVAMVGLLATVGYLAAMGWVYFGGVAATALILGVEHWMVRDARHDGRSARINAAFFNANASVSIIFFASALLDRLFV